MTFDTVHGAFPALLAGRICFFPFNFLIELLTHIQIPVSVHTFSSAVTEKMPTAINARDHCTTSVIQTCLL